MPDKNKLAMMREMNYRIVDSCATCRFGLGRHSNEGWGRCSQLSYKHDKHSDHTRPMPAHTAFICDDHERAEWVDLSLNDYADEALWREA